jgi:hypothetical protein
MPCVLPFCSDVEDDPCHGAGGMQRIGFSALRESERTGLPSDPNAAQQLASAPSPVPPVGIRTAQCGPAETETDNGYLAQVQAGGAK